ncbi:MAG: ACR3 family arsenite efflux transporter [Candidatus Helarchaeota archaeon]
MKKNENKIKDDNNISIKKEILKNNYNKSKKLNKFEKYLFIWVAICIAIGIIISKTIPMISELINSMQIRGISIPIAICLFIMMYPAMLNVSAKELRKLGKHPHPIILTLISNWLIAPFVGMYLASIFLQGSEQLIVAIILLSASPCTAMVLVWGYLAGGNQEQNIITTSINTISIIIGYAPLVAILTGIQNIAIDKIGLLISLVVFIGGPLITGIISKKILINRKGHKWFENTYRPIISKIAIIALLATLIVIFSLNGNTIILYPMELILVSIPLLIGFAIVVSYNILITKLFKLKYREAIITVIIGSSSHFEIAIASAVSIYGIGSLAALGTTMGLFWEVPIMLSLVYLGKFLKSKKFWKID